MILLINPPIYDFSAYNLWAKPVGLLKIASILKKNNKNFFYIDTLDISDLSPQQLKKYKIKIKNSGRHNYIKNLIEKPLIFKNIKKKYYRFGLSKKELIKKIRGLPQPRYVIITSLMTYWYYGVVEIIKIIKRYWPEAKIILGGIYVNLCYEHAIHLGADFTVKSIENICKILNIPFLPYEDIFPLPLNLYNKNFFAPIYTSFGCPFSCAYCANKFLNKTFITRDHKKIINEILYYYSLGIKNFAFYDDALLINKKTHFIPLIKKIIDLHLDINFYCPNGLHIAEIDEEVACLMKQANFKDIRLSLETANKQLQLILGYKTNNRHFQNALQCLKQAGFSKEDLSVYLLVGLPYQEIDDIIYSIKFAKQFDIKIKLAEYSPIPHTSLWYEAINTAKFNIENEPLYQNNKILPVAVPELTIDELNRIKNFTHH